MLQAKLKDLYLVNERGFTLIELLIAIVIVGILVGIALPSYTEFVNKGRRADAMAALLDAANRQEQFMLDRNQYANTMAALGLSGTSDEGYYTIAITASTATTYTLRATPADGSPQVSDDSCTAFFLTNTGAKTATGLKAADCWSR